MNLCITELALCSQKLRAAVKMSSAPCYWRTQQNPSPKNYEINDDDLTEHLKPHSDDKIAAAKSSNNNNKPWLVLLKFAS